ncbi:MAG: hypothetical protein K0Q90_1000 [Paenibacillaceae bacterium]|nr:hypothetical protein [Paenibacillaceae bacterium]
MDGANRWTELAPIVGAMEADGAAAKVCHSQHSRWVV